MRLMLRVFRVGEVVELSLLNDDTITVTIGRLTLVSVIEISMTVQKENVYVPYPNTNTTVDALAIAMSMGSGKVMLEIKEDVSINPDGTPISSSSQLLLAVKQRVETMVNNSKLGDYITVVLTASDGTSWRLNGILDNVSFSLKSAFEAVVTYRIALGST